MRLISLFLAAATAFAGAVLSATAEEERGFARPGGAFAVLEAADPAACSRLCAEDGLCMAWTQLPNGVCELKAVVPAPVSRPGAVSGVSARAPAALRVAPAPQPSPPDEPAADAPSEFALSQPSIALLGGPDAETALLRPRFGGGW